MECKQNLINEPKPKQKSYKSADRHGHSCGPIARLEPLDTIKTFWGKSCDFKTLRFIFYLVPSGWGRNKEDKKFTHLLCPRALPSCSRSGGEAQPHTESIWNPNAPCTTPQHTKTHKIYPLEHYNIIYAMSKLELPSSLPLKIAISHYNENLSGMERWFLIKRPEKCNTVNGTSIFQYLKFLCLLNVTEASYTFVHQSILFICVRKLWLSAIVIFTFQKKCLFLLFCFELNKKNTKHFLTYLC